MRIVLCGQRSFGAAVLDAVQRDGHHVPRVICPADAGDPLHRAARERGIDVRPAGEGVSAEMIPNGTDLILAAHSHDWISKRARHAARYGAIGYHPSLLPRHRGRSAIEWAIRDRDMIAGGSVYWLDDRIDAGDIAAQDWCWIRPDDDASALWRRELFPLGVRLIRRVLADLDRHVEIRAPQDERLATWEPAIDPPRLRRADLPELAVIAGADEPVVRTLPRTEPLSWDPAGDAYQLDEAL